VPEADYVSDVFVGPRKEGPEKIMAVDYARHGIELGRRSESELAALFKAELTRAVRYELKRSETAERFAGGDRCGVATIDPLIATMAGCRG
jgi:hypothetical protein